MNKYINKTTKAAIIMAAMTALTSCHTDYKVVAIEGGRFPITSEYDNPEDSVVKNILAPYKATVDSIMSPVIGHSSAVLTKHRPESKLSNLLADILRHAPKKYIGKSADVAVMNMGGIRTTLPAGEITYGNIYEISPFQNTLCYMPMKGSVLIKLFENIAAVGGEGLSGARLEISKDGKLLSARVGGKPVDSEKIYIVSTIDYIAEGNDKMYAFKDIAKDEKILPEEAKLRDLFVNYVKEKEAAGEEVNAEVEGRILIK